MRVEFVNLDDMLEELSEKQIKEVRVDALCVRVKEGTGPYPPVMKACVSVDALLPTSDEISGGGPPVYGHYERVSFTGPTGAAYKVDWEDIQSKNLESKSDLAELIENRGFTVRAGHFEEA